MEASHALQRRLVLSLARSFPRCSLSSSSSSSQIPLPLHSPAPRSRSIQSIPSQRRLPLSRPFCSSRQWWQDEKQPTSKPVDSSAAPEISSKQAVQSYISAVNTIIDGFKLKESLSPRQHEQLVVALTNAEIRVGAPHAHPDSFSPLLESLQGEINPILQRRFGTTDVQSLRSEALAKSAAEEVKVAEAKTVVESAPEATTAEATSSETTSPETAATADNTTATATPTSERSISQDLDTVFGARPKGPSTNRASKERADKWASLLQNPLSGINADLSPEASSRARSPLAGGSLSDILNRRSADERRQSLDLNAHFSAAEARAEAQFRAHYPSLNTNMSLSGQSAGKDGLRLKPSLGRTVETSTSAGDLTRAFRSLEALCKRNQVSYEFNKQRFHVRRGQRRKDLRSQRWRKQFAAGFLEECKRIRRMRAQGW